MNYFAPERPKLENGLPRYFAPDGTLLGALPQIIVEFHEDSSVSLKAMLSVAPNRFAYHEWKGQMSQLGVILTALRSNPEDVFLNQFKWRWENRSEYHTILTLDDLFEGGRI